jgi:hypothetical protein
MVAAMDLAMAIAAGAVEDEAALGVLRSGRMTGLHVTQLTESRFGKLEERFVVRAVGFVAVGAALCHRRVFPQKGTPLLRVTGITVLVDRVGLEEALGDGAVGVVTVRAGHLPLP